VTCPAVIDSAPVQAFVVVLTGVLVVFGIAAVGPSLQAAATATPRQREARVKRDNIL